MDFIGTIFGGVLGFLAVVLAYGSVALILERIFDIEFEVALALLAGIMITTLYIYAYTS